MVITDNTNRNASKSRAQKRSDYGIGAVVVHALAAME